MRKGVTKVSVTKRFISLFVLFAVACLLGASTYVYVKYCQAGAEKEYASKMYSFWFGAQVQS